MCKDKKKEVKTEKGEDKRKKKIHEKRRQIKKREE